MDGKDLQSDSMMTRRSVGFILLEVWTFDYGGGNLQFGTWKPEKCN